MIRIGGVEQVDGGGWVLEGACAACTTDGLGTGLRQLRYSLGLLQDDETAPVGVVRAAGGLVLPQRNVSCNTQRMFFCNQNVYSITKTVSNL